MQSKLAAYAEQALIEAAQKLTYEQRLIAFFEHSRLITELYLAGRQLRSNSTSSEVRDQQR